MSQLETAPEVIRLASGMTALLQPYESAVATLYWWVRVGSADEQPAEAGFAHFLEHMLFKDTGAKETGQASSGKTARLIESLGGDINAFTSFDQTVYHVTCAATHWEKVMQVFLPMIRPQKFLKTDFEREREVILEELRKNNDSPDRQLFQHLFGSTFKSHPYGRPVIGTVQTLKSARVATLERFYREHYSVDQMGLILVGPLSDRATKARILRLLQLETATRSRPIRRTPRLPRKVEPPERPQAQWSAVPFDVKTPTLALSFRVPELTHPDTPTLDCLAGILGNGELSRLYQKLFYAQSLVTDVSASLYVPQDAGMIYIQAECTELEKILPVVREIFAEIQRLERDGVESAELDRIVVGAESERLYASQTADGLAGRLGFLQYIARDLQFDDRYLERLRALRSMQVQAAARHYLTHTRLSGVILYPKDAPLRLDAQILTELVALSAQALPATPTSTEKSLSSKRSGSPYGIRPTEELTLPSGLRARLYYRPQSHVISVHTSALGGVRLELGQPWQTQPPLASASLASSVAPALAYWGVSHQVASVWTKGTATHSATEISQRVEAQAASLDGFSGKNSVGLQFTGLGRHWDQVSDLYREVLTRPTFPATELEHSRRIAEESLKTLEDHSSQLCAKLFTETLFTHHPYGKISLGSLETIGRFSPETLLAVHHRWIQPSRLSVSISGSMTPDAFGSWLEKLDGELKKMGRSLEAPAQAIDPEPPLEAPRQVEQALNRGQSHIMVGRLGISHQHPDRYILRLLQTILGGQSGRLFIELREKQSLAYTVSPMSFEGLETGYLGVYIGCAPTKVDQALEGIRAVLERLAQRGPTEAEMKRARQYYLGRRCMDLQGDSALAAHLGMELLYGVPSLTDTQLRQRIEAVSRRDVQRACQQYWIDPHPVTAIVR